MLDVRKKKNKKPSLRVWIFFRNISDNSTKSYTYRIKTFSGKTLYNSLRFFSSIVEDMRYKGFTLIYFAVYSGSKSQGTERNEIFKVYRKGEPNYIDESLIYWDIKEVARNLGYIR